MSAEEYLDNYICENIGPFEDKLSKEEIEEILNEENIEYDINELDDLLKFALSVQNEIDEQGKIEVKQDLYQELDDIIMSYESLDYLDVGTILVQLANSYLNGD